MIFNIQNEYPIRCSSQSFTIVTFNICELLEVLNNSEQLWNLNNQFFQFLELNDPAW